jgi:hypothetical protein
MVAGISERATLEHLNCARTRLSKILPPHADKIVRALQHVELALQYHTIDSESGKLVHATRIALRTLNQIENQQNLPPAVRFAVGQATHELANIIKAIRASESLKTPVHLGSNVAARPNSLANGRSDGAGSKYSPELELHDDDDTMDGLECLPEDFEGLTEDFSLLDRNPS